MQTRERVNAARAYVLTANTCIFSLSVHGVLSDEPPLIFQMIKGVLPVSVFGDEECVCTRQVQQRPGLSEMRAG